MASWLTAPVHLTGDRAFDCDGFTKEQCTFYKERWHFWYIADYVFALPTIAFFMSVVGIFIIGHIISSHILGNRKFRGPLLWQKLIAFVRYMSYRGLRIERLHWNSAPVGLLLLGAAGGIYFFCMDLIPQPYYWSSEDFGGSPPLGTRSGWMALACMPFVFATASKTNWITLTTGVSHEKIQVFHRWSAYAFFLLALMHTFPFIIYHIRFHDMVMEVTMMSTLFYWTGIVALVLQGWLTFASHSVIRHLGYEFCKVTHLFAVLIFVVVFFWHCDYTLTSWHYFIATAAIYVPCSVYPWLRIAFKYGFTQKAHINIEQNGFMRLTIPAVNMRWKPGQHCFLRFASFGFQMFSSHPFTMCSLPTLRSDEKSELVFYIRHSRGLTKKLYEHADKQNGTVSVLVDGPYGGINLQRFNEAHRLLVVAGGSGAGWVLPLIELFCRQRYRNTEGDNKDIETGVEETHFTRNLQRRSLRVILATRDISSRAWFLDTTAKLLASHSSLRHSSDVDIEVYLTGEGEQKTKLSVQADATTRCVSSSSSDNIKPKSKESHVTTLSRELWGRPDLPLIIHREGIVATEESYSMGVYVCGPTTMQNEVRNAVAKENFGILKGSKSVGVYLHSEHFSWA